MIPSIMRYTLATATLALLTSCAEPTQQPLEYEPVAQVERMSTTRDRAVLTGMVRRYEEKAKQLEINIRSCEDLQTIGTPADCSQYRSEFNKAVDLRDKLALALGSMIEYKSLVDTQYEKVR